MGQWADDEPSVLTLSTGRRVRGREIPNGLQAGHAPEVGVYLSATDPRPFGWPAAWVRWHKFWIPTNRAIAEAALREAWRRCTNERVEIASPRGRGRTGTALACLAVLDGTPPAEAMRLVKDQYHGWTVGTPWTRWFIGRFARDHHR